ncbi:benzoate 4-monooxygenase cytochrome P450 [Xylaria telfairii]|nr:benzoate 4-monooxygenase cytochrome P450 [Xylaria telfairii]
MALLFNCSHHILVCFCVPCLALIAYFTIIHQRIFYSSLRRASGVPGPWLSKITRLHLAYYELLCRRNTEIFRWHHRYGPVVRLSPNEVSVSTLDAVRQVYTAKNGWSKSSYFDNFMGYNQRPIFAVKPSQEHSEKRKLTSAFYQPSALYNFPDLELYVDARCKAVLKTLEHAPITDVYSLTDWYAFDVITYVVFGPNHGTHCIEEPCEERAIIEDLKHLQFFGPFSLLFPGLFAYMSYLLPRLTPQLKYLQAEKTLAEWCRRRISEVVNDPMLFSSRSLLRQLMQVEEKAGGQRLDPDFVAAELLDNINAARATVTVTATYLIWLLSRHPAWQYKVNQELRALSTTPHQPASFSTINNRAPILEACIWEVYRLYPASSGRSERVVPAGGCILSDVYLPANTTVMSCVLALHRDETVFPDPETFNPQRWLGVEDVGLKIRKAQLIPFGYGGRICLGKALATMEIKMLAAHLYFHYETAATEMCTPESLRQSSTHDAVPRAKECLIRFRKLD